MLITRTYAVFRGILVLILLLFIGLLFYNQFQVKDEGKNAMNINLENLIREEFARIRRTGELKINVGGNDILPAVSSIIKVGDSLEDVEALLLNSGFKLSEQSNIVKGSQVYYVYAISSKILGSEGESIGSEVTIRLQFFATSRVKQITGILAFITTTEL